MYVYLVTTVYRNISSNTVFLSKKKAEKYYKKCIQSRVDTNEKRDVKVVIHENETRFGKICFMYRENIVEEPKIFQIIELQKQPIF